MRNIDEIKEVFEAFNGDYLVSGVNKCADLRTFKLRADDVIYHVDL